MVQETLPKDRVTKEMIEAALQNHFIKSWHRWLLLAWLKNDNQPLTVADMVRAGMTSATSVQLLKSRLSNIQGILSKAKTGITVCSADLEWSTNPGKRVFPSEQAEKDWVLARKYKLFVSNPQYKPRFHSD